MSGVYKNKGDHARGPQNTTGIMSGVCKTTGIMSRVCKTQLRSCLVSAKHNGEHVRCLQNTTGIISGVCKTQRGSWLVSVKHNGDQVRGLQNTGDHVRGLPNTGDHAWCLQNTKGIMSGVSKTQQGSCQGSAKDKGDHVRNL